MPELFAQLMRQDFAEIEAATASWKKLAKTLDDTQAGSRRRVSGPLHKAGWTGAAATNGFEAMEATETKLGTGQRNALLISVVLHTLTTKMQAAQRKLRNAVSDAERAGHTVRDDGWVEAKQAVDPAYHNDPDYQGVQQQANSGLGGFRARIDEAVGEAVSVSSNAAETLRQLDPFDLDKRYGGENVQKDAATVAAFAGIDPKDIPDGKDPQRSKDWWAGLDDEKRGFYLAAYPDAIGALDGLPTPVRDHANRDVLDQRLNDYALRESSLGYHDRYGYRGLTALKDRLETSDSGPANKQLYLLGFGTEKDGRAIVALGNPDTARHTAVLVPGTDTQLDKFGGQINRIGKLQDAAATWSSGAGSDVSVISWMDYDAPEPDGSVATTARADAGAEDLRDFTHGLRAAHQGEPTHLTVVGHSYGSTMTGAADAGGAGLGADDVLVVGSPGLTVEHADQLHVAPSHLWVGAAKDDMIANYTSGLTLGEDPKEPGFGAQRMFVDTSGHSGYWDEGSKSLNNQGRIIAGMTPEGPRS
ncbi:alpha/beta hydrolase family protein [Streptomyces sp. NBC_00536]|uniref:alpha/beta hydrolase n=1 Tax=Streptomyces sp. NBC_00536 TaxID=2975769 RepID=UPI002E805B4F|nr:alpha/beta hydrolase [Streptomyces sp. NBC_00536]WUC80547.1 alpha/beta hydrolase family protein [Streptomyces sp. NBC_00536]